MIMKSFIAATVCSTFLSSAVYAQQAPQIESVLVLNRPDPTTKRTLVTRRPLFLESVKKKTLYYRTTKEGVDIKSVRLSKLKSVYMTRPKEYINAVELYENRQYELALPEFQKVKEMYKQMADIDNSYPALAGLYELDCYRKLKQYSKLSKAEKVFAKSRYLTKESHKQQLKLYKIWAQLEAKAYPFILNEYKLRWKREKLTGSLRSQIEYIYGRALEASGQPNEALIAYSKAMLADFANSEVLTLEAIDASFRIIQADEAVEEVRKLWDRGEVNLIKPKVNTMPYFRLLEAGALVRIHDKLALSGFDKDGNTVQLDPKFKKYLKYTREAGQQFLK